MGEWLLSRRDRLIVARHEVTGLEFGHLQKVTSGDFGPKKGPRPVGTTPIVARHEVPGKASLERTVP
jgi:hypothetical protein